MNGTPKLRSSFPTTPSRTPAAPKDGGSGGGRGPPLPQIPQSQPITQSQPVIPINIIDAPSQRFYVFAFYVALLAWRVYDWAKLVEDEAESFWLFIKWVAVDGVFLYGLPSMRIPWLEWSSTIVSLIFVAHAILNGMLMFRIPIPLEAWLMAFTRVLYDRELSISEHRVKPASILHNSSLIMGKQIINILPEGSVILNPDSESFCVGKDKHPVKLPIYVNQTKPIRVELLRVDFDTNTNETIEIKAKEMRSMWRQACKSGCKPDEPVRLEYQIKKPGLYRLQKVIDESKLEVQRRRSDALVVECPRASIKPASIDRCVGDLSDLTVAVEGTPPLKLVYSRTVNREDRSFHFQSIQPENLVSPYMGANALILPGHDNMNWASTHRIEVRLNESMTTSGDWLYSIDEIHDAAGNVANFSARGEDGERILQKVHSMEQRLTVHERPIARLDGCDSQHPLKVASGTSASLPVAIGSRGRAAPDSDHVITWQFTPLDKLTPSGDHGSETSFEEFVSDNYRKRPSVRQPGLYTLRSVRSSSCEGEIQEPSSCLLLNPPKPDLAISSQEIYDKCAGSSIGLLVDLTLVGTPPFFVRYEEIHDRKRIPRAVEVDGFREQIELKPTNAGHYVYRFISIDDALYTDRPLDSSSLKLEQDVRPPASAVFVNSSKRVSACLGEPVSFQVQLQGDGPFTLEFEVVHDGKRSKQKVNNIDEEIYTIVTDPLIHGGDYSLALSSVQDKSGCKVFVNDQVKIDVRRQRPKAAFGKIEGKQALQTLEGKSARLPLRLEGESGWTVKYLNRDDSSGKIYERKVETNNAYLTVSDRGSYELVDVSDSHCPGTVDSDASAFEVAWIARPELRVTDSAALTGQGNQFKKREVCEGDMDSVEVNFLGTPPYHLKYQHRHKATQGSTSINNREIDAALPIATIPMDTTKPGLHKYEISELSDGAYDHDKRGFSSLVIEQTVNAKPSAYFSKPGQSYKYCTGERAQDEIIPITLIGQPPFSMEIDIKHQSSTRPETVKIANIETKQYGFRIPQGLLSLGTHQVSVRTVRDANGCSQRTEYGAPNVQVQVFDVPTVYPLESRTDYCVGDRISYTLSGTAPFDVYYTFNGVETRAKSTGTTFRRIAERPGEFAITAISDKASECRASVDLTKTIHELPSVRISRGQLVEVDIHEGGQAEILFEFWGTPPFEFTYTRSTNAKKGQRSQILETRHDVSYEYSKVIHSSQEGTYEVVAIKDRYCAFSTQKLDAREGSSKLLY